MLHEINRIFNSNNYNLLDKNNWVTITNSLIKIDIDKYSILKYKQDFDNIKIIENVINHNVSHSHSVIYINPKYRLKKIRNAVKINTDFLYPYCISNLWKSNLISTSDFEDKLFFIMSFLLDNIKNINNENIIDWIDMIFYIKKKSVNDILQKLIWEIYNKIFNITKPIFVDVDISYFIKDDWIKYENELINNFNYLSNNIIISECDIIALDERQIEEFITKK